MTTRLHASHPTQTCLPASTQATGSTQPAHAATRLLPRQTRVIHASAGLTLEVLQGRLWLTRPGDLADRFLNAGDRLELTQDWVVIEADAGPLAVQGQPAFATAYRLRHHTQPVSPPATVSRPDGSAWRHWLGPVRWPLTRLAS